MLIERKYLGDCVVPYDLLHVISTVINFNYLLLVKFDFLSNLSRDFSGHISYFPRPRHRAESRSERITRFNISNLWNNLDTRTFTKDGIIRADD